MPKTVGYNQRLFARGLRAWFHYARFRWFQEEVAARACRTDAVLELGCFDGKLLDFIHPPPARYVGFDADWEGGLAIAASRAQPNCRFLKATSAADMVLREDEIFTLAVCMETLEHVPPALVDGYLGAIAAHLDGYLFITVPNEKGAVFLAKWLAKRVLRAGGERYTFAEVVNATLGRTDRVARGEHKGFDWQRLLQELVAHFELVEISGHPLGILPPSLCFTIGIVARSRAGRDSRPLRTVRELD
ncbi:MAG: class I SAM-dependent methyltransferase [Rhodanobacteraceae bacterium]